MPRPYSSRPQSSDYFEEILSNEQSSDVPAPPDSGKSAPESTVTVTQNAPFMRTGQVQIAVPGKPTHFPAVMIPDGFSIAIKSRSTNSGTTYLGYDEVTANKNGTDFWDLTKGESVSLQIKSLAVVYYDGDTANDIIMWIVEQA